MLRKNKNFVGIGNPSMQAKKVMNKNIYYMYNVLLCVCDFFLQILWLLHKLYTDSCMF